MLNQELKRKRREKKKRSRKKEIQMRYSLKLCADKDLKHMRIIRSAKLMGGR